VQTLSHSHERQPVRGHAGIRCSLRLNTLETRGGGLFFGKADATRVVSRECVDDSRRARGITTRRNRPPRRPGLRRRLSGDATTVTRLASFASRDAIEGTGPESDGERRAKLRSSTSGNFEIRDSRFLFPPPLPVVARRDVTRYSCTVVLSRYTDAVHGTRDALGGMVGFGNPTIWNL